MTHDDILIDPTARRLIEGADLAFSSYDWGGALAIYKAFQMRNRALADALAIPVAIAHCEIELGRAAPPVAARIDPDSEVAQVRTSALKSRALTWLRDGDPARASRLLRLLASYDPHFSEIYANDIDAAATGGPVLEPADAALPPCVATVPSDAAIARIKAQAAGARVLLVARTFLDLQGPRYPIVDDLRQSAARFGLAVRQLENWRQPTDAGHGSYPEVLRTAIADWRPQLLIVDDLFERGLSADPALCEPVGAVLEDARRTVGVRVVKLLPDGWLPTPESLYRGLGTHFDLLHHLHPARLAEADAAQRAATFCYPFPFLLPSPTGPFGIHARLCFVGSINRECPARLAWWAEVARAGLPLDVHLTDHFAADRRSEQDYVNLLHGYQVSVNFTRRHTGIRIATARVFETMLSGGVLLEEDSVDTRTFLKPGAHYVPFNSLAALQTAAAALLTDPALRRRIARDGQAWVKRYFTGDHFWAGLLDRLAIVPT
jgi:hypothetical protein